MVGYRGQTPTLCSRTGLMQTRTLYLRSVLPEFLTILRSPSGLCRCFGIAKTTQTPMNARKIPLCPILLLQLGVFMGYWTPLRKK